MRRAVLCACLALAAGCKGLPDACSQYDGHACISLEIDLGSGGPVAIDTIRILPVRGFTLGNADEQLPQGTSTPFPLLVAIVPQTIAPGDIELTVRGLRAGDIVGDVGFSTALSDGEHVSGRVALGPPEVDMATPLDLVPPPPPDMVTVPPCDPVAQTYCPTGQKCQLNNGSPACIAAGTVAPGRSCQWSPDDCSAGNFCYVDSQGPTWCEGYCNSNSDCKAPSIAPWSGNISYCHYTLSGTSVKGCTTPCNPVVFGGGGGGGTGGGSGCVANSKCDVIASAIDGAPGEITSCDTVGTISDGQNCTYNTDCIAGFVCVGSGQGHCRAYCRSGVNSDCTAVNAGYSCVTVSGWSHIGACCPAGGC